jgi:hypothetical protein
MDLNAIIAEFNRRKSQAQKGISDLFQPSQQPSNYTQNLTDMLFKPQGYEMASGDELKAYAAQVAKELAQRAVEGGIPAPIRQRDIASRTDPSAAGKPFSSDEVRQMIPYVTGAAPIAYHGSPHTFEKFDASKIGTGEGAQAYGHGLYFAENPKVASEYHSRLANPQSSAIVDTAKYYLEEAGGDASKAVEKLKAYVDYNTLKTARKAEVDDLIKVIQMPKGGGVYRVNIPDEHAARMLDWDKPLSEQAPSVKAALETLGIPADTPGPASSVVRGLGGDAYASKMMLEAGIPGIKYLDQASRTAGEGTRNFVVFDPAILKDVSRQ